jgi:hypothetical protein
LKNDLLLRRGQPGGDRRERDVFVGHGRRLLCASVRRAAFSSF